MSLKYNQFLSKFPPVQLPVTLSEEDARLYSAENEPLPDKLTRQYILPNETVHDDLTEYVPCFRLEGIKNFDAIVYWKAGLMNYQYILLTLEKGGKPIARRVIAGTTTFDGRLIRSVARLDNDMSISIVTGPSSPEDPLYEASKSTTMDLEILPDGKIVELS